jgi:branched-chain amino acid transport system permease protein
MTTAARRPPLTAPQVYVPALFLVAALVAPQWFSPFYLNMAILFLLFAIWGHAWNIIGGYGNSLSLGHAAFVALGAYVPTMLLRSFELTPLLGVFAGMLAAMAVAAFVGWVTFRLKGAYFAIGTLAIITLLHYLTLHFRGITGGAQGISVPFRGHDPLYLQFSSNLYYYYILLAMAVLVTWIMHRFDRSQFGYHLRAAGQEETAAQSIGIDTRKVKLWGFLLSAAITAAAATVYTQFIYHIDPFYVVHIRLSILILLPAVIGGLGTVWGPVVGAALLVPIEQIAQRELGGTYAGGQLILYGLVVILVLRYRPEGIVGLVGRAYQALLRALPGDGLTQRG